MSKRNYHGQSAAMPSAIQYRLPTGGESYNPRSLKTAFATAGIKEARAEYTRLRDIAQKRLKRLQASEYKNSNTVRYNQGGFVKLKNIKSAAELAYQMTEIRNFLEAETSTVYGQKQVASRSYDLLRKHGYKVSEGELRDYGKFMDNSRAIMKSRKKGESDRAYVLWYVSRHGNASQRKRANDIINDMDKLQDYMAGSDKHFRYKHWIDVVDSADFE